MSYRNYLICATEASRPTNVEEGMICICQDTNLIFHWDGAAWIQVPTGTGVATGTNTGDNATNTLYSGLVTNATHTGDAEGATALTVKRINGTALSGLATGILKNTTTTGVPSIATNADLPVMSATVGGAVPTPPNNTTTFLRGDGTFAAPSGGAGDMVLASVQTNSGLKTFLDTTFGLRNVANTFTSLFTNAATAARTWTLKDADGTLAFVSDITGTNSGTNTGDNSVNTLYSSLVTNATHTGDATGATALTVVKIQGKDFPTLAVGDDQKYPKYNHGTNAFVMTAVTAAAADQNPNLLVQATNYTIPANYGLVVPSYYKVGDSFTLTIASGAILQIT